MKKITVTGPKTQLENVLDATYDLELLDFDEYEGELEKGSPMDESEELSELLVDIRSLISKLNPEGEEEASIHEMRDVTEEIAGEVKQLENNRESIKNDIQGLKEKKEFYRDLKGVKVNLEDITATESLKFKVLDFNPEKFRERIETDQFEVFEGEKLSVLTYRNSVEDEVEHALRELDVQEEEYSNSISGMPEEAISNIDDKVEEKKEELKRIEERYDEIKSEWGAKLNYVEDYMTERVEKADAPLNFAMTDKSFIAEGWVPSSKETKMRNRLISATENKLHIEIEGAEEEDNPPVKYKNNRAVQPFESLTDLMARPKYNEIDPSFMILLTFPLFFGFMIGDAGYGLTSALVFYGGMKMFPQASDIFKSLIWCSAFTFIFGLAFGDAFGYVIFGPHSELAAATGLHFLEQIPILFHRVDHLGQIFNIAIIIGFVHINLGILLGAYNEYINHGVMEAVFAKGSWMLLQIAAITGYLVSTSYGTNPGLIAGLGIAFPSLLMLYKGEGIEGIVEIPSLISNILSYLRLFGVTVAAISLAQVVNTIANPLLTAGTAWGLVAGIGILMFGHIFNTFIKIMEGFLQGIRLHYVEMFGHFYHGGGRKYNPFGGSQK